MRNLDTYVRWLEAAKHDDSEYYATTSAQELLKIIALLCVEVDQVKKDLRELKSLQNK